MGTKPRDTDKSGIYQIRNTVNDKVYIGSSCNLRLRKEKHFCKLRAGVHNSSHLQNAFNKYGEGCFEWIVLEEVDRPNLIKREQHHLDAVPHERRYNVRTQAERPAGVSHSAETRAKISAALQGHSVSQSTRSKLSAALKGKMLHADHVAKIAAATKGRRHSEEARARMSEAAKARPPHTNRARAYPALRDPTGRVYPAGTNLAAFCREHGLRNSLMYGVISGDRKHHKGWQLG